MEEHANETSPANFEARIAPAAAPWPASVQSRFDKITPIRLFRVLARDERLFARFMDGGFLDRGHLSLRERELAILTVCARYGSEYEWGVHVSYFAERAGFSETEVVATLERPDAAGWTGRDALIVRLCDALQHGCEVTDEL
jgi:hypothetical protein